MQESGTPSVAERKKKVLLLGATGTIGRATAKELISAGYLVRCLVRQDDQLPQLEGAEIVLGDVTSVASLEMDGFGKDDFDVLVSCLASRSGEPDDAWAIDAKANQSAFKMAREHGVKHIVYLSAICVQKPRLAFQHAKLAAEASLIEGGVDYTIVRPTAFFKSLSGQIARVQKGKPFLVFGDGEMTACKPISDRDLAKFLAGCLDDPKALNQILPIGGPGKAMTARQQGEEIFKLLEEDVKIRSVPIGLMKAIVTGLSMIAKIFPSKRKAAELARIGHYYATESMLVWDEENGRYDANATPSFGQDHLRDYYAAVINGEETVERGEHSIF